MATVVDELVAKIGIEVDKQKLDTSNKALKNIITQFVGIKTSILAASIAAFEFERRMTRGIATLGNSATLLNANAQDLQVLEFAAQKAGVSFETVKGAISKLNTELSQTSLGNAPKELVKSLLQIRQLTGIKVDPFDNGKLKTGEKLFNDLIPAFEKLQKTRPTEAFALSENIFGSNILPVMNKIAKSRKELSDNNLILNNKDIQKMVELNNQFILLSKSIGILFDRIAIKAEPIVSLLLKLSNFLGKTLETSAPDVEETKGFKEKHKKFIDRISLSSPDIAKTTKRLKESTMDPYKFLSGFSTNNVSNNSSTKNQSSVVTHNDNRVTNSVTNSTVAPSNMQSIYHIGGVM